MRKLLLASLLGGMVLSAGSASAQTGAAASGAYRSAIGTTLSAEPIQFGRYGWVGPHCWRLYAGDIRGYRACVRRVCWRITFNHPRRFRFCLRQNRGSPW